MIKELPLPSVNGVVGGIPGGLPGGILGGQTEGVVGSILGSLPHPPPPPVIVNAVMKPRPTLPRRIHVGGNVEAALLVHKVTPVYPELAREARIGGLVRMKAVIDPRGSIKDLSVLSGPPMLVHSALDAVKQWVYRPTYLNGTPVEVDTEIDVRFNLTS
jgi:protein TonB